MRNSYKNKPSVRIWIIIVLASLLMLQAPNSQASAQSNNSFDDWLVYEDGDCGFSFQYPPDSFNLGDQGDAVRIGLSIMSGTNLIEKYVDITCSTDSTSRDLNLPSVGEISNINVNGIDFQVQSGGEVGAGNLYQATKYSTQKENQYISLTFVLHSENGSGSGLPEFAETERIVFEQIMSTFKFSSPDASPDSPPASPIETDTNFEGQIAYVGVDGNVYLLRGDTREIRQVTSDATTQDRYTNLKFSSDGQYLAFVLTPVEITYGPDGPMDEGPLFVADASQLTIKKITERAKPESEWVGNSMRLSYIQDGILYVTSIQDSTPEKVLDNIYSFSWSPNGDKLIYANKVETHTETEFCGPSEFIILDIKSQSIVKFEGPNFLADWSSDENWIEAGSGCLEYGGRYPYSTKTGGSSTIIGQYNINSNFLTSLDWAPVGDEFVATMSEFYSGKDAILIGKPDGTLNGEFPLQAEDVRWSPSGNKIAAQSSTGVYLINPGTLEYQKISDQFYSVLAWSPTGQQLLLSSPLADQSGNYAPTELVIYDIKRNSTILNNVFAISRYDTEYVAWSKLPRAQISYSISGNTSLSDQTPLPGVSILVDGTQSTTDQSGNFRIDGVSAGQHSIEPRLDGYLFDPPSEQIDVQGNIENLQFVGQKSQPNTGYTIAGRVVDSNGRSLAGVSINLDNNPPVLTGEDGRYRIENLAPRTYTLGASLGGYKFHPEPFTFNLDKDKLNFDFRTYEQKLAVQLVALEVTQGLQDLNNSIPLVIGKPTVVRAYFLSTNAKEGFEARLVGRKSNGQVLEYSPIYSTNPTINHTINIDPKNDIDELRKDINLTLNFEIPNKWMDSEHVEFEIETNDPSYECRDLMVCPLKIEFHRVSPIKLDLFRISWQDEKGNWHAPTAEEMENVRQSLIAYYPISNISGEIHEYPDFADPNALWIINLKLGMIKISDWDPFYVGILVDPPSSSEQLGVANWWGRVASGFWLREPEDYFSLMDPRRNGENFSDVIAANYAIPHEIGHLFGFSDITECTSEYPKGRISPELKGKSAIYGLTIPNLGVLAPDYTELMNYCIGNKWISGDTYKTLLERIYERFGYEPSFADIPITYRRSQDSTNSMFIVNGYIDSLDGAGKIVSVYSFENINKLPPPIIGGYAIQLLDESGALIQEIVFEPFQSQDGATQSIFNIPVYYAPETKQIKLVHNGQILDSAIASSNKPNIEIIAPKTEEVWKGESARIEWMASDNDQDMLTYVVQLSFDGGNTWQTQAVDLTETKLDLPLEFTPGTEQALVRVLASDGFYTAQDTSDTPFTISGHNPSANISSPINGREYDTNQLVILYGDAYDAENGLLSDSALGWSSDKNGVLGTGQSLTVKAGTLQPGIHTITLTATDQDGNTAQSSIQIIIKAAEGITIVEPLRKISPLLLYGGIAFVGILMVGLFGLVAVVAWRHKPSPKRPAPVNRTAVAIESPVNKPNSLSASSIEQQVNAAIGLSKSGKYQESYAILREVVKVEPNNAQAWLYLGVDLVNLKDFVNAERCLQRAKKLGHPKADQALEWLRKKGA